ncbi:hypothetical protein [Candidatus Binatus sp.]|uniref:hypothetical protein n=1 Tax=Candidatus Binatus sp. TaxID=2811406 RepID=UPI002F91F86F
MNPHDLFLVALLIVLLVALGIGSGIMNNLATLTSALDELRQLLDSKLRPGVDKDDIDPVTRLAAILLEEKREAHKCPECGALPVFETSSESARKDKGSALFFRYIFSGGLKGGYWKYPYHLEDCSLREPESAAIRTSSSTGEEE